jgi:hypothetical protein
MPLTRPAPTDYLDTPGVELDLLLGEYADAIDATEAKANAALMAISYRAHILYRQSGVTYRGAVVPSLLNRDARYHAERSPVAYQAICLRRTYRTTSVP